jgi:hypothetical protein
MADEAARRVLVRHEQRKLVATLFNNVAVAFIVTGLVVPVVALAYGTTVPRGRYWVGYALLWLVMAGVNHQMARMRLARMEL